MATAKKLPSGNYRCFAYGGKDEAGKVIRRSFTAPTKKEAELLAITWLNSGDIEKIQNPEEFRTFGEKVDDYIILKAPTLSPSTIGGYRNIQRQFKKNYADFYNMQANEITAVDVQRLISDASLRLSPKTIRNYHGLISAVLSDLELKTRLPQKKEEDLYIPTDEDIVRLLQCAKDQDDELYIPIMMGAYCMMRRGEIVALDVSNDIDFKKNMIHINKDCVLDEDSKQWVIKPPKTVQSNRWINVLPDVTKAIKKKGYITTYNANVITQHFGKLLKDNDFESFNFHKLRHYCASHFHAVGVPDAYIMAYGGWKSTNVLNSIYRHALIDRQADFNSIALDNFSKMQKQVK